MRNSKVDRGHFGMSSREQLDAELRMVPEFTNSEEKQPQTQGSKGSTPSPPRAS